MPYEWTGSEYKWTPVDYGGADQTFKYAGALPPRDPGALSEADQYQLALTGQLGAGYRQRPGVSAYAERMQQPLLGQYILSDPSVGKADYTTTGLGQGFGEWLAADRPTLSGMAGANILGGMGYDPSFGWQRTLEDQTYGVPAGAVSGEGIGSGEFTYGPLGEGLNPWTNIVNYARAQAGGAGPDQLAAIRGAERWENIMADPASVQALANLAMYDPRAGSLRGRLAGGGRTRQMQQWQDVNPEATSSEWLSKIAEIAPGTYRQPLPA